LPEPLLESELFGHERGAFTGADRQRVGRFELANGGTLFLDEIGDMSLPTQGKLLRVLQEQTFERVGGEKTLTVDVRLIAATNKHLETEVRERRFRDDLYYRLNVVTINLPPLRERREDILLLARHFLDRYARDLGKPIGEIDPAACELLENHSWFGNIRELENTIERAVLMAEGSGLRATDLGLAPVGGPAAAPPRDGSHPRGPNQGATQSGAADQDSKRLDEIEKNTILRVLAENNWVQKDAARLLGISPRVLNYKIKNHGITHPSWLKHRPPGYTSD
jgi:transcriptional regulator with GAF, ATPase, and Fis domain